MLATIKYFFHNRFLFRCIIHAFGNGDFGFLDNACCRCRNVALVADLSPKTDMTLARNAVVHGWF